MACPRCERANENLDHILRECPVSVETDRNKRVHERQVKSGREILNNIFSYLKECRFRSSSRVVARSIEGVVLVSRTVLHKDIDSAFAAEALSCF
ncbi:hypothetical protein Gohar_015705 [Gossypium harknessii]|uniref:Reverse transcriptase zinc-binding domain-containing protein n=1 Tax=Gossypium harknessii TaxID=34285 RepID=A0A7J9G0K3_9ROSI|nr:hypothetical protein [Gossypium harknessii]